MNNEDWITTWHTFSNNLPMYLSVKAELLKDGDDRPRRIERLEDLIRILRELIQLLERELQPDVLTTALDTSREMDGDFVVNLTGEEMTYMNERFGPGTVNSEEQADDAIESAKTVKESIEDLFSWIPRHKKIFNGLNEILSLGRLA